MFWRWRLIGVSCGGMNAPIRENRPLQIVGVADYRISVRRIGGPINGICISQIGRGYAVGEIDAVGSVSIGVSVRMDDHVRIEVSGRNGTGSDRRQRRTADRRSRRHRRCADRRDRRLACRRRDWRWRYRTGSSLRSRMRWSCRGRTARKQAASRKKYSH